MSASPSAQHSSFTIERMLPGRPSHAWRFWADPALKQAWSGCHPDWTLLEQVQDFRAGGRDELVRGARPRSKGPIASFASALQPMTGCVAAAVESPPTHRTASTIRRGTRRVIGQAFLSLSVTGTLC